jgi:hypothetical protein
MEIKQVSYKGGSSNAIYVLGVVGAAIYYLSKATGFWNGVLGLLKSFVWPAYLVYESLKAVAAN